MALRTEGSDDPPPAGHSPQSKAWPGTLPDVSHATQLKVPLIGHSHRLVHGSELIGLRSIPRSDAQFTLSKGAGCIESCQYQLSHPNQACKASEASATPTISSCRAGSAGPAKRACPSHRILYTGWTTTQEIKTSITDDLVHNMASSLVGHQRGGNNLYILIQKCSI